MMSDLYSLVVDKSNKSVHITGELSFASVNALLCESDKIFATISPLTIDLSAVERSDSAGLALLIHWIRKAKQQQQVIHFQSMPKSMMMIAKASNLDSLIPTQ